jgi:predicted nucleic acid-binding protein
LWLSSVVLEELYAGAQGRSIELVEKLERDFKTAQRILTPNTSDWAAAGRVLARIGTKYGFDQIGKARLTNDTLIAVSSSRTGTHVLTANAKDFGRIAEFRKFEWELVQPRDLS